MLGRNQAFKLPTTCWMLAGALPPLPHPVMSSTRATGFGPRTEMAGVLEGLLWEGQVGTVSAPSTGPGSLWTLRSAELSRMSRDMFLRTQTTLYLEQDGRFLVS